MTTYNEPTAYTGELVSLPSGSPRWLQVVRDVLLSVAALLVSAAILWAAVAVNRAGDALSEWETGPAVSDVCTDPNVPWCDPAAGE